MRQKLAPRTVRRPSPTPAVMVRLRSTNTKKIQFTQRLPLGSELHMGKERCCFRGLDHLHGPTSHSIFGNLMIYKPPLTNDRLMFEHDESLRADLLPINFPASYENGKLEHFLHRWMKNREHNNLWLTMFPEKRYFRETTSTTEVAIHTNPFTDRYASIGTGSSRTGGCILIRLCTVFDRDGKRFPRCIFTHSIGSVPYLTFIARRASRFALDPLIYRLFAPPKDENPMPIADLGRGKNSVPLSGCCWTDGLLCWQVMPFGLNHAIVTYQRAMNLIFHYFIVNIVEVVYIDDVVVKSFPVSGYLSDLKTVFERENTA
uniref:Cytochrome c biogenesis FC n=1 Tax=Ammopiptanthus mongolicus TaxID=126911 RepID=A0A385G283_AMMMO|nr:cytochrome c biogenesis FC [Ammopiptanthus mongolicus]AXV54300.1 cytochrome c biogenesis FC [Ammopiptanthus mongolicus]